jgi:hypothetical protein
MTENQELIMMLTIDENDDPWVAFPDTDEDTGEAFMRSFKIPMSLDAYLRELANQYQFASVNDTTGVH